MISIVLLQIHGGDKNQRKFQNLKAWKCLANQGILLGEFGLVWGGLHSSSMSMSESHCEGNTCGHDLTRISGYLARLTCSQMQPTQHAAHPSTSSTKMDNILPDFFHKKGWRHFPSFFSAASHKTQKNVGMQISQVECTNTPRIGFFYIGVHCVHCQLRRS